MTYQITDRCVSCAACEAECPVSAIAPGESQYNIDPEICIGCGACESTCPTSAIEQA